MRILVVSDVHWACPSESARSGHEARAIRNPLLRLLARGHRRFVWLAEPHAHNHRLDAILRRQADADWLVANGDYTVDSGFIGVSDAAALESAGEALSRLRAAFPGRMDATIGDHDLGKQSLFGGVGGPRRSSLDCCGRILGLPEAWHRDFGRYRLLGLTSTLLAWPVFAAEALPEERDWWWERRRAFLESAAEQVRDLPRDHRIVLFVHDPTALPFLAEQPWFSERMRQVEATVVGHLHTESVMRLARVLAGIPAIEGLGVTVRRYSAALQRARAWEPFRVLLCPSPPGIELLQDGGFLTLQIDPDGREPLRWARHWLPRDAV